MLTGKEFLHSSKPITNQVRAGIFGKADHKFLFILSPPFCGSTLLNQVISTSKLVSVNNEIDTREGQTLPEVREMMFDHDRRWNDDLQLDWPFIRKVWLKYWDRTKPVLLEKSPPNIVRAGELEKHFAPAYFIIFHRNPYAHVQSLISRKDPDIAEAARFAMKCLKHQKDNIENLKNHVRISYEDLTDEPEAAVASIRRLLPELDDMKTDQQFTAHNFKQHSSMKITNLNDEKIRKLTDDQLEVVNGVFGQHRDLLAYFGYEMVMPKAK